MGLGIIISGVFILKKKPNAKFVAGWIACAAALYAIGKPNSEILFNNLFGIDVELKKGSHFFKILVTEPGTEL